MVDEDEVLDLVDEKDHVIGTIARSQINDMKTGYIRAAELLIQNDEGKLWIPRRQMHKRIAPGGLDFSMGGHVSSAEDYKQTLVRETAEELNLKFDESKLSILNKFSPNPPLRYLRTVYLYKSNETPRYNPEDFSEYYWLSPQELLEKLGAGEPAKKSLAETVEYLIKVQQ
jgi:isopentenyldiphosphate isomerase